MAKARHKVKTKADITTVEYAMKNLPIDIMTKLVDKSLRPEAKAMAEKIKERVPVDTGFLKSTIMVKKNNNKRFKTSRRYAILAEKYAFYWYFLEYGTSKMLPRPFITPVLLEQMSGIVGGFSDNMRADLPKILKYYAKYAKRQLESKQRFINRANRVRQKYNIT